MGDASAAAQVDPQHASTIFCTPAEKQVLPVQPEQPFGVLDGQLQGPVQVAPADTELSSSSLRSARLRRCTTSQLPSTCQGRRASPEAPPGSAWA